MAKVNLPILYNQMDSRWGQILLGFNTQSVYNFYNYACLICSLAMIAQYYGKDWNPVRINDDFKSMGAGKAYAAGGGDYVPGGFHALFADINENRVMTPAALTDSQINEIKSALDQGIPVMIGLDYNPKTVKAEYHFVVIVDYNPADENDFTIADPLGGKTHSLKDYLGFFVPNARNTIQQYTIISGKLPKIAANNSITVAKSDWDQAVANNEKWNTLVHYFDPNLDPTNTPFEQIQSIIAGYKSRSTDMENKANQANADLAVSQQEVKNNYDQISRIKDQLIDQDKAHKAEKDALIAGQSNTSIVRGEYEARLSDLQGKLDVEAKAKGQALLDLAKCQAQTADMNQGTGAFQTLVNLIFKYVKFPTKQ